MAKRTPVKAQSGHDLSPNGVCMKCMRSGADIQIPCPGYQTAGDYLEFTKQKSNKRRR